MVMNPMVQSVKNHLKQIQDEGTLRISQKQTDTSFVMEITYYVLCICLCIYSINVVNKF